MQAFLEINWILLISGTLTIVLFFELIMVIELIRTERQSSGEASLEEAIVKPLICFLSPYATMASFYLMAMQYYAHSENRFWCSFACFVYWLIKASARKDK